MVSCAWRIRSIGSVGTHEPIRLCGAFNPHLLGEVCVDTWRQPAPPSAWWPALHAVKSCLLAGGLHSCSSAPHTCRWPTCLSDLPFSSPHSPDNDGYIPPDPQPAVNAEAADDGNQQYGNGGSSSSSSSKGAGPGAEIFPHGSSSGSAIGEGLRPTLPCGRNACISSWPCG